MYYKHPFHARATYHYLNLILVKQGALMHHNKWKLSLRLMLVQVMLGVDLNLQRFVEVQPNQWATWPPLLILSSYPYFSLLVYCSNAVICKFWLSGINSSSIKTFTQFSLFYLRTFFSKYFVGLNKGGGDWEYIFFSHYDKTLEQKPFWNE